VSGGVVNIRFDQEQSGQYIQIQLTGSDLNGSSWWSIDQATGYDANCTIDNQASLWDGSSTYRYVRFQGLERTPPASYGYSIWDMAVYSDDAQHLTAPSEDVGTVTDGLGGPARRGVPFHFCGWSQGKGDSQGNNDVAGLNGVVSWTYDWSDNPGTCVTMSGDTMTAGGASIEFVPMAWGWNGSAFVVDNPNGSGQLTHSVSQMESAIPSGAKYILGWNEPDFQAQAGLTPKKAAMAWTNIEQVASNRGLSVVGPAVNYNCGSGATACKGTLVSGTSGGPSGQMAESGAREQAFAWLEHFYNECQQTYHVPYPAVDPNNSSHQFNGAAGHTCKIDYQAVHSYSWYGIWSINPLKIKAGSLAPTAGHCTNGKRDADEDGKDCGGEDCKACDTNVQNIFKKQVWLTEFAPSTDDCNAGTLAYCQSNLASNAQGFIGKWVAKGGNPGSGNTNVENEGMVFRYSWFMAKIQTMASLDGNNSNCGGDSLLQCTTSGTTPLTSTGNSYKNAGHN
jgi:hypothetical protein